MNTKVKSNSVVSVELANGKLQFTVVGTGTPLVFNHHAAAASLRERAELHGWKQRISDAAAIPRDTETGASATPAEKRAAMQRLIEHYESGTEEWSLKARSGLELMREALLKQVREALVRLGIELTKVSALADDKLKELAGTARVRTAMLEIEQERARVQAPVDGDVELDGLLGE